MRKIVLMLMAVTAGIASVAQDAAVKEMQATASKTVKNDGGKTKGQWTRGGMFTLNVNQGGYDNWVPTGDADYSIGLNGYLNLFANRTWAGKKKGKAKRWSNNLEIFQAMQTIHDERTDANRFDKLDDRIDFLSRYSVQLKDKISFSTIANARTQMYDTKKDGKRISGFFAPAVVTLAPGIEWKPCDAFTLFYSPATIRWIFVTNGPYSLQQNIPASKPYGVNPDREVDIQPGGFLTMNFKKELDKAKKITLTSRLDLFSNYRGKAENVDVFFTNFLSMKVNKWINVGINLDMIYDDDIKQFGYNRDKAGLQYKHIIGVGMGARF
jgi:hypothetical protein